VMNVTTSRIAYQSVVFQEAHVKLETCSLLVEMATSAAFRREYIASLKAIVISGLRFLGALEPAHGRITINCEYDRKNGSMELVEERDDKVILSVDSSRSFLGSIQPVDLDGLKIACADTLMQFSHPSLDRVWLSESKDEILGEIKIPEDADRYYLHPAILDGVFQLASFVAGGDSHPWILSSIASMLVTDDQSKVKQDRIWVHISFETKTESYAVAYIELVLEDMHGFSSCLCEMKKVVLSSNNHNGMQSSSSLKTLLSNAIEITSNNLPMDDTTMEEFIYQSMSKLTKDTLLLSSFSSDLKLMELGVDSLGAVALRNDLFLKFDIYLENSFVISNPSIKAIMEELKARSNSHPKKQDTTDIVLEDEFTFKSAPGMEYIVSLNERASNLTTVRSSSVEKIDSEHVQDSPLFLFHDVTGQVVHLKNIASLLPLACFGVECDVNYAMSVRQDENPIKSMGISYAKLVLLFLQKVGVDKVGVIRIGGYSYGCRIAYASMQYLESLGYVTELILLDGALEGPITVNIQDANKLATEIFLHLNSLEKTVSVDSLMLVVGDNEKSTNQEILLLDEMLGRSLVKQFLKLRTLVQLLSDLTSSYMCNYKCKGRAIHFSTSSNSETNFNDLISQLQNVQVTGHHFDFFRVDAVRVAKDIAEFLSNRSDQSDNMWFSMTLPHMEGTSESELTVGIKHVARLQWRPRLNLSGQDPRSLVEVRSISGGGGQVLLTIGHNMAELMWKVVVRVVRVHS
jgi:thioesterase domain-containing protein